MHTVRNFLAPDLQVIKTLVETTKNPQSMEIRQNNISTAREKVKQTKKNASFITFDVVNFYPSMVKNLMLKSLQFAENYTTITQLEKEIITQAKDTMLLHDNIPWKKSGSSDLFDVTMGSFDGAETCDLGA